MKIISDYKDYYDSVAFTAGMVDDTLMYKRLCKKYHIYYPDKYRKKPKRLDEIDFPINYLPRHSGRNNYDHVHLFVIGFCGKMYVGAKISREVIRTDGWSNNTQEIRYSYDLEDIVKEVEAMGNGYRYWFEGKPEVKIIEIRKFFVAWNGKEQDSLFHEYNTPIWMVNHDRQGEWEGSSKLLLNPELNLCNFFKIKDAFSAFQEISMYLGGVLGNNPSPTPPLSEKQAVISHGFDEKYGFRKRKK
jgi:hypothetical protein